MTARPILFSGPMVRAILEGRKTQTRRIVTAHNSTVDGWKWNRERFASLNFQQEGLCADRSYGCGCLKYVPSSLDDDPTCGHRIRSIYEPPSRLWVRETTERYSLPNLLTGEPTSADAGRYVADEEPVLDPLEFDYVWWYSRPVCPAIHMPRWASRITLEVTGVRVERLQDITEEDARAEGIRRHDASGVFDGGDGLCFHSARRAFDYLWSKINGPKSWTDNPFVWVVEFKRLEQERAAA